MNEDRICYWDSERTEAKLWLSCHRSALPGRMVCHKHAPMVKRRKARPAKNKTARVSRKLGRKK